MDFGQTSNGYYEKFLLYIVGYEGMKTPTLSKLSMGDIMDPLETL